MKKNSSSKALKNLFGSKTRIKLLSLYFKNPQKSFYVRELTRLLNERINSVRRELANLTATGLLFSHQEDKKLYYSMNQNHSLYDELKSLFLKAYSAPKERIAKELEETGDLQYVVLSGSFTNSPSKIDILVIGDVIKDKLDRVIRNLEKEHNRELNYTVMSYNEYNYRRNLDDRFLKSILDHEHNELINHIKEKQ